MRTYTSEELIRTYFKSISVRLGFALDAQFPYQEPLEINPGSLKAMGNVRESAFLPSYPKNIPKAILRKRPDSPKIASKYTIIH